MLITQLTILAKILISRLQAVLFIMISHEQNWVVKSRTIQGSIDLVRLIIGQFDSKGALIYLYQSKLFDRVDNQILETVLLAAWI